MMYIRLAVAFAFAVIVGTALYYRAEAATAVGERDRVQAAYDSAITANQRLSDAITRLEDRQRRNDALLTNLVATVERVNTDTIRTREALTALRDTNEDVRAFLSSVVPDDLRGLLNNPPNSQGNADSR